MRVIPAAMRGRGGVSSEKDSWHLVLEIREDGISNAITSVQKDYLVIEIYETDQCTRALQNKG